jgi:hypothetical protein
MGFNAEGRIKPNSKDAYILELEQRISELEKPRRRILKKWDFSNIISPVGEKDLPWV